MTQKQPPWSALEKDALQEHINLGVGRAAAVLSEMTSAEILLSVPDLTFANLEALSHILKTEIQGSATSIRQSFSGKIEGAATLIFVEKSSEKLVEILLGDAVDITANPEIETEALAELGNIVINSCLGELADHVTGELRVDLPLVFKGNASKTLFIDQVTTAEAFLVRVSLQSNPTGIGGLLVFTLMPGHLSILRGLLNDFVIEALPA